MDAQFYVDSKPPFAEPIPSAVTLTTTFQALAPPAALPTFPPNYFGWVGKAVRMRMMGILTSGATPGNWAFNHIFGSGANNTGSGLCGITVSSFTANVTNAVWVSEAVFRCRAVGTSGVILAVGWWQIQGVGLFAVPPNNFSTVSLDLTQSGVISPQMNRSGSTAESAQLFDVVTQALN